MNDNPSSMRFSLLCLTLTMAGCASPCEDSACEQRRAAAMQYMLNQNARPAPEPYYQIVAPVPMQGPQQQILSGSGVTANWTGRQWPVTTITNQRALSCEYRYGGQVFTRIFPASCPPTVQAQ